MMLASQGRHARVDIVREAGRSVPGELDLPDDWLNDAAKGLAPERPRYEKVEDVEFSNLRIQSPVPEYLLAMKVMAARAGFQGERGDGEDIQFLIELLQLRSIEEGEQVDREARVRMWARRTASA